jgi:hypothetical protein
VSVARAGEKAIDEHRLLFHEAPASEASRLFCLRVISRLLLLRPANPSRQPAKPLPLAPPLPPSTEFSFSLCRPLLLFFPVCQPRYPIFYIFSEITAALFSSFSYQFLHLLSAASSSYLAYLLDISFSLIQPSALAPISSGPLA